VQPSNLKLLYAQALDPSMLHSERPDRQGANRHRSHSALAPTAKAPRPVHPSPVTTRANATCAPNGRCCSRLALRILCIALSFLTRLEKSPRATPFHHKHNAIIRRPVRISENAVKRKSNFGELRYGEVVEFHF
jgi:hypothetical protein